MPPRSLIYWVNLGRHFQRIGKFYKYLEPRHLEDFLISSSSFPHKNSVWIVPSQSQNIKWEHCDIPQQLAGKHFSNIPAFWSPYKGVHFECFYPMLVDLNVYPFLILNKKGVQSI